MADLQVLKDELTIDPEGRGYSGMSDEAAASDLNDTGTGRTLPVDTLSSAQIYEAIDTAEFNGLTDMQRVSLDRILGLGGDISVDSSSKARAVIVAAFGSGTNTRTALLALVVRTVSRGVELGLGRVKAGQVQMVRAG